MAQRLKSLVFATAFSSTSAAAFDIGTLTPDPAVDNFIFFAVILLAAIVSVSLWSMASSGFLRRLARGPRAENLFLSCRVKAGDQIKTAHLRQIDGNGATLVVPDVNVKDDQLQIDLASLPGFGGDASFVHAKVIRSEVVRGSPPSYIIVVDWDAMPKTIVSRLTDYITQVSGTNVSPRFVTRQSH